MNVKKDLIDYTINEENIVTCPMFDDQQDFIFYNLKSVENYMLTNDINYYSPHMLLYLNL